MPNTLENMQVTKTPFLHKVGSETHKLHFETGADVTEYIRNDEKRNVQEELDRINDMIDNNEIGGWDGLVEEAHFDTYPTPEQLATIRPGGKFTVGDGPVVGKGEPFKYEDFTQEQLDDLKVIPNIQLEVTNEGGPVEVLKTSEGETQKFTLNFMGMDGSGKVKLHANSELAYVENIIDGHTIVRKGNYLCTKLLDGQIATVAEINFLEGATENIQDQINVLKGIKSVYGVFNTKAALDNDTGTPSDGQVALIRKDENYNDKQTSYVFLAGTTVPHWEVLAEVDIELPDIVVSRERNNALTLDDYEELLVKISEDDDNALEITDRGLKVIISNDERNALHHDTDGLMVKIDEAENNALKKTDDGLNVKVSNSLFNALEYSENGLQVEVDNKTTKLENKAITVKLHDDEHNLIEKKNDGLCVTLSPDDDNAINKTENGIKVAIKEIFDAIYPVGSFVLGTKPSFGTWTKVGETKILSNTDDQYIVLETGRYNIGTIETGTSKGYTIAPTKTGYDCIGIIPIWGGGRYYSSCCATITNGGTATARTCNVGLWNNSATLASENMFVEWTAIFRSKYGTETVTKWKRTA